jgi:hypothetical protein
MPIVRSPPFILRSPLRVKSAQLTPFVRTGYAAITQILRVVNEQSQPTFDANFNRISYYNWTGGNGALSPAVPNAGNGEPKAYTGAFFFFFWNF